MKRRDDARRFAQPSFGAITHYRPADAARGGEADADEVGSIAPMARLGAHGAARTGPPAGRREEVRALF